MNWMKEIENDQSLNKEIQTFYNTYGTAGLKQAIDLYKDMRQIYICKTKTSTTIVCVKDIYYLEIRKHHISVHTVHGVYHKYGTLNEELKCLAPYGFLKCNQSFLVSLDKIRSIAGNDIILTNGSRIPVSRNYAQNILLQFYGRKNR